MEMPMKCVLMLVDGASCEAASSTATRPLQRKLQPPHASSRRSAACRWIPQHILSSIFVVYLSGSASMVIFCWSLC